MVPCMADHPIPKLTEAVGDSTPSGQNIEENEPQGLGNRARAGDPPGGSICSRSKIGRHGLSI